MSNQENAVVMSKDKIAQFVHDAADMEKREYSLREIAVKLESDEDGIRRCAKRELDDAKKIYENQKKELQIHKQVLAEAKQELGEWEEVRNKLFAKVERKNKADGEIYDEYGNKLPKKPDGQSLYEEYKKKDLSTYDYANICDKNYLGYRIAFSFFVGVILFMILVISPMNSSIIDSIPTTFFPVVIIAEAIITTGLPVGICISICMHRRNRYYKICEMRDFVVKYEKEYAQYERELAMPAKKREEATLEVERCKSDVEECSCEVECLKAEVDRAEKNVQRLKLQFEISNKRADWVHGQIVEICNAADIIRENKVQLYEFGIVPPDYRSLDAVLMIANIFDNDLADTMREAVLLYDERVFRGEVVRGIDNINKSLSRLNQTMSAVVSCLYDINRNVSRVALEINGIANQIYSMHEDVSEIGKKILKEQRKIADDSRATRFAAEAIQKSAEKLEWYAELRIMGLI